MRLNLISNAGESQISFIGMEYRNSDLRPEVQRYCMDAFLGCEGFTYNVTRMHGQPTVEELKIRQIALEHFNFKPSSL